MQENKAKERVKQKTTCKDSFARLEPAGTGFERGGQGGRSGRSIGLCVRPSPAHSPSSRPASSLTRGLCRRRRLLLDLGEVPGVGDGAEEGGEGIPGDAVIVLVVGHFPAGRAPWRAATQTTRDGPQPWAPGSRTGATSSRRKARPGLRGAPAERRRHLSAKSLATRDARRPRLTSSESAGSAP